MQNLIILIIAVCAVSATNAASNSTTLCPQSYWGPNCANFCGYCHNPQDTEVQGVYDRTCDSVTGGCANGCQGGWSGANCDEAVCEDGCNGGECIAPNVCGNCPTISHISPGCTNIKLRGLLGSLTAFAVLIFSLASCAFGSILYERRKNTSVAL
uniref:multiple epidermal growth factor-like domains protein 11 n=1 Tax=Styela clava TaxID=7725 RepID=UPI0019396E87|nr:multiple epidermal growth factor-like domains protein 11 [Styela clava]